MLDMYPADAPWGSRTNRRPRHVVQILNHFVSTRGLVLRLIEVGLLLALVVALNTEFLGHGWTRGQWGDLPFKRIAGVALYLGVTLSLLQSFALYQRHRASRLATFARLAFVYAIAGVAFVGLSILLPVEAMPQAALGQTLAGSLAISFALRLAVPRLSTFLLPTLHVLVVGNGRLAQEIAAILASTDPSEGLGFRGVFDPRSNRYRSSDGSDDLPASLAEIIEQESIGEVVLAAEDQRGLPIADLLRFRMSGVQVTDYVTFLEREKRYLATDTMRPSWLLFSKGFDHGPARVVAKRLFDIVVSLLLLILLAPPMLMAIIAILIESGRPVFFRQQRVGLGGKPITIMKLRSMVTDAERDGVPQWAEKNDARITPVGRALRMTRLDEVPQLLSVLKGDMSFVGPRPEREFFVQQLRAEIPYYDLRHTIKPGLSGWAQVSYPYGASVEDARAKLRFDLYYIKNHSLMLDILILLNTIRIVVLGTGAR